MEEEFFKSRDDIYTDLFDKNIKVLAEKEVDEEYRL